MRIYVFMYMFVYLYIYIYIYMLVCVCLFITQLNLYVEECVYICVHGITDHSTVS